MKESLPNHEKELENHAKYMRGALGRAYRTMENNGKPCKTHRGSTGESMQNHGNHAQPMKMHGKSIRESLPHHEKTIENHTKCMGGAKGRAYQTMKKNWKTIQHA